MNTFKTVHFGKLFPIAVKSHKQFWDRIKINCGNVVVYTYSNFLKWAIAVHSIPSCTGWPQAFEMEGRIGIFPCDCEIVVAVSHSLFAMSTGSIATIFHIKDRISYSG